MQIEKYHQEPFPSAFIGNLSPIKNKEVETPDYNPRGWKKIDSGFTLIELLVVVLIIGILAAVAVPQYQKAVVKSRFSEALSNLKTMAIAHQTCYLEKGEVCLIDELTITPTGDLQDSSFFTKYFSYGLDNPSSTPVWSRARYLPEDVCICYLQTGEFVLSHEYEDGGCGGGEASYDYAKLLGIREVPYRECGCC